MTSEFDLIERYFSRLGKPRPEIANGIGDDCARVTVPEGYELAVSIDTLVAGVHFPEFTSPEDLGWKSLACGLSDLAATGAEPCWAMLAVTLPHGPDLDAWLDAFVHGFAELAHAYDVAVIGGDTTAGPLSVTVQVAGHVPLGQALQRRGACAGDVVCVSGSPGEAAAALAQLQAGVSAIDTRLHGRLVRPEPRVELGRALRGRASACIDVSDGLAADAAHVAAASGVRVILDEAALPRSTSLQAAGEPAQVLRWLLGGGDDYELCFTLAPADVTGDWRASLDVTVTAIGQVEPGEGVHLRAADGRVRELSGQGYRHFDGG